MTMDYTSNPDWLQDILCLGDNRALLPMLVRQVREAGVIPFVGAGLSAQYNLPQWSQLIQSLAPDDASKAEIDRLLAANDYEAAAEYLMELKGPRQFQLLFREKFDIELDLSKKSTMACLARLPRGPIITTNFDRVLESVLESEGCPLDVIVGEQSAKISEAFQYNTDALLKVHGDIQDPADRVLTKPEYDAAYSQWLRILLKNVATRCLLFLGCSLKTDRPMQVLAELVRERHVQIWHFAILSLPDSDAERLERSRMLTENHHIQVIWYPTGKHDYVESILSHIADQVPPEQQRNRRIPKRPRYRDIPETRFFLFGRNPQELVTVIEMARIVVVEGNRGVGKTAFALQALRQFMDRDTFGALAWITASASKEQLQLSHVLDTVSLAIDFPFKPQTRLEEKEALLAKELERKNFRCLLLLDNYETVTDPNIDGFLFDPGRLPRNLTVLITSTGRLVRDSVQPFPLDELGPTDAAAMFRDRLTRDGLEQESDTDVTRLYQVVGGNPLAIEWIVGQMRAGAQLPRLLSHLQKGKADILPRVFAQSWQQLHADQCTLLAAISIFVRPALEEALQAASGQETDAFHDSLEAAMRLYLIKRLRMHDSPESLLGGRRYFVHPFTRDYLEGQREPALTAALFSRTSAFYLKYVTDRGGTPEKEEAPAIRELNGERENILGVLDGCLAFGNKAAVVPLVQAMARWLFIESHWDDLEKYGNAAMADAVDMGDNHPAARILSEVGRTYSYRSDFVRAAEAFDRALQLAGTEPPDEWALAYIRHHAGEALMRQKRYAEAEAVLVESLNGFTRIGSVRSMIGVRYRMAMLALESAPDHLDRARELATKGVEDTIGEGWKRLEGFNRRLLGDVAVRQQDFVEARYQYERALALVPLTDMRIQALLEFSLALLDHKDGRIEDAKKRAVIALGHFEKLRMPNEAEQARRLASGVASKW
jgi:tetratricopeptide (TPR) repeat protein